MTDTLMNMFYATNAERPVAYIDESYDMDPAHTRNFYSLSAVLVESAQRDVLRSGLVRRAASSYWHTSEALRTEEGRVHAHTLLTYLADDAGSEQCVISVLQHVQQQDDTGELAE